MKKIKVLHIVNSLDKGGLEEVVYNLVKNSNSDLYDVSVAFFQGGLVSERLAEKGFKCFEVSADTKLRKVKVLSKVIRDNDIDIVQSHYCFTGILAAKLCGVKVIETVHNTYLWFQNLKGRLIYSFYLNAVDVIVPVSAAVNQFNLDNFYIINKKKCIVIRNSVDSERIVHAARDVKEIKRDFGLSENAVVISTLSRIDVQKGLEHFIEVAKQLSKEFSDLEFLIPGAGEEKYVKELKEEAQGYPNIKFIGHVSNVGELFKIMDVYVMSSLWEGAPLTLLEAMAYGKAVVVTNVGNTSEVIKNGKNGFLLEKKDIVGMRESIKLILSDKEKKRLLEENARADFKEKFSNEIMISKYKELYKNIVG